MAAVLPFSVAATRLCPGRYRVVDARGNAVAYLGADAATAAMFAASPEVCDAAEALLARILDGADLDEAFARCRRALLAARGLEVARRTNNRDLDGACRELAEAAKRMG